jgi:hypothetical protein
MYSTGFLEEPPDPLGVLDTGVYARKLEVLDVY